MQNVQILLSDARGQYIPRDFVQGFAIAGIDGQAIAVNVWQGISAADVAFCNNPDDEWYWDAWATICDNAYMIDANGTKWSLYQNGDLFAVAYDNMTEEEMEEFFGN